MISSQVEVIGPKEARSYLRQNSKNRHLNPLRVKQLARDMANNAWSLNGETIKFAADGQLLDGQHRLQAIVDAGKQVPILVVRGLDNEAQATTDMGAKRTFGNILQIRGEKHANTLASGTRWAWSIENWGRPPQGMADRQATVGELLSYLDANPGLRDSTQIGVRIAHSAVRYPQSAATSLHYIMAKRASKEEADLFWTRLRDGDIEGTPIYVLRETLLLDLGRPHHMSVEHRSALTVKAWNAVRDGRTLQIVSWRPGAGEKFPEIK